MTATLHSRAAADRVAPRRLAWQHGAGKDLIADPGRVIPRPPPHQSIPFSALAHLLGAAGGTDAPAWAEATAYALTAGVLPTRWDDWSAHNAHRPFPSPRAKQAHEIVVRTPQAGYAVDEVRGSLAAAGVGGDPAIVVHARSDRIPQGYGRMRIALSLLEVGHLVEEICAHLRASGRRPRYAVRQDGPEQVAVVLTHTPDPAARAAIPAAAGQRPRRCSGLDVRGLSPDPRPLAATALATLLAHGPVTDGHLRHRLALRGIEAMSDTLADATADGLQRIAGGGAHERIDRAVRGPRGVLDVARMNVLWGIASPLSEHLHTAEDYARTLVRTGAAAQRVCRAAAHAGLFARPLRGIDEPDVEAALRLPSGEDLLYLIVIGRPRVHGFTYDLTPATPPGLPARQPNPLPAHPKELRP